MSAERLTVLGAGGWVGSALVRQLKAQGEAVQAVGRQELEAWLADTTPAAVVYTIGLTADFRERPHATAEAHVSLLSRVMQRPGVQRLLLLSSTRVYGRSHDTREEAPLSCLSSDPSDLYNLSKLMGEALVLQHPQPGFQVVRLSNVVGPGQPATTFLGQLLQEAEAGVVRIRQPADTSKDYVALNDVVRLLPAIAREGQQRLYNLASGTNTSHQEIARLLEQRGVQVHMASAGAKGPSTVPNLCIERLAAEFAPPASGLEACRELILGRATSG